MALNEWLLDSKEPFFGTDRNPHIALPNGFCIIPDRNVSDIGYRTWRERLFTRPWKPLIRNKPVTTAYVVDKTILVSWATYLKIKGQNG